MKDCIAMLALTMQLRYRAMSMEGDKVVGGQLPLPKSGQGFPFYSPFILLYQESEMFFKVILQSGMIQNYQPRIVPWNSKSLFVEPTFVICFYDFMSIWKRGTYSDNYFTIATEKNQE